MSGSEAEDEYDLAFLAGLADRCKKARFNFYLVRSLVMTAPTTLGPQGSNRTPETFSWPAHCARMNAREFGARYRLTPTAFDELHELLQADLSASNTAQAERSRGNI
jgi:hypothetical protein